MIGNAKNKDIRWIWLDEHAIKESVAQTCDIKSPFENLVMRLTRDTGSCGSDSPRVFTSDAVLKFSSSYMTPEKHLVYCGTWWTLSAVIMILNWRRKKVKR